MASDFCQMRQLLLLFLVIWSLSGFGQSEFRPKDVRPEVSSYVDSLIAGGQVEGERVRDTVSVQFQRYKGLMTVVTPAELSALTDHPEPVIRCYAFMGLAENPDKEVLLNVLHKNANDTALVRCEFGNRKLSYPVIFYCLTSFINLQKKLNWELTPDEQKFVGRISELSRFFQDID